MSEVLEKYQEEGLVNADKCPVCNRPNIIHRKVRNDYICGWCKNFFKRNGDGKIEHLGQRIKRNGQWKDSCLENQKQAS